MTNILIDLLLIIVAADAAAGLYYVVVGIKIRLRMLKELQRMDDEDYDSWDIMGDDYDE